MSVPSKPLERNYKRNINYHVPGNYFNLLKNSQKFSKQPVFIGKVEVIDTTRGLIFEFVEFDEQDDMQQGVDKRVRVCKKLMQ